MRPKFDGLRQRICNATVGGTAGIGTALALLAGAAWALPEDRQQDIEITGDETSIDTNTGVAVVSGDVRIEQGSLRIRAATVTYSGRDGQVDSVVAEGAPGAPATFRQRLRPGEPFVNARAGRIRYAVADARLELTGGAFLAQDGREFSGDVLHWDMEAGTVDARSERPGGVKVKLPAPASN